MHLNSQLNIIKTVELANIGYNGVRGMIKHDTSEKATAFCLTTSPCFNDNLIVSFNSGPRIESVKINADLSHMYWHVRFDSIEGDTNSHAIDHLENTIYYMSSVTISPTNSFLFKVKNEDGSKVWGKTIDSTGTPYRQASLLFYSDYLLVVDPSAELFYFNKNNGTIYKRFIATSTLLIPQFTYAMNYGNYIYGCLSFTQGSFKVGAIWKSYLPSFNTVGSSSLLISSSSGSLTCLDSSGSYSLVTGTNTVRKSIE